MTRMARKRALEVRKENLKQHSIDSRRMTQELEMQNRPTSSSEQAKRRRYNTRSTSATQPTSSTPDFSEPLNPFLSHSTASNSRLTKSSNVGTNAYDQAVHGKDDNQDFRSINGTGGSDDGSDSSYQVSHTTSIDTTPKANRKEDWVIFYPLGVGKLDYPEEFRGPVFANGRDVADILWNLRQVVASKLPYQDINNTGRYPTLDRPHEFLVLNHIYLIERDDDYSSIYACLGHNLWRAIQAPPLAKLIDDQSVIELVNLSFRMASVGYQEGREMVRQWQGNQAVGDILLSLFMTNILWDTAMDDDNEVGLTKKKNDPFLLAYITHLPHSTPYWDKTLPPSEKRRGLARDGNGARPDFYSGFRVHGKMSYLLMVEIKKKPQGDATILTDLEKLALEMKDCIDAMARNHVDIIGVKVFGYTVVDHEIVMYSMSLEAPGIYMMLELGKAYLPRNHHDLTVLPNTINLFLNLQRGLEASARLYERPLRDQPYSGTCETLGTPMKRYVTK
ncbi:hypothetical protein BGW41_002397 [Actinomortierella wolfii]|nr:hypothetical protein BGW41_002397 [Actinomortierella wolfii]